MQKFTRLATENDISKIMLIIADAKEFLKQSGSTQWQSGYPDEESIKNDIKNNNGYVFMAGNQIAGYAAVIEGIEPTYNKIDGKWENDVDKYATIHRLCFSSNYQGQGLAKIFLSDIVTLKYANGIKNFRVDTHRLNIPMQTLAEHNGFTYRGIIKCDEEVDPDRLAYELNL